MSIDTEPLMSDPESLRPAEFGVSLANLGGLAREI
jgi:hypothetical protein